MAMASNVVLLVLVCFVSRSLARPTSFEDEKHYYNSPPTDPHMEIRLQKFHFKNYLTLGSHGHSPHHASTPHTPSHGGGGYNPTPSHGGGSYNPTPSTPSHGGGSYNPTPSHGGGSYNPTPSTPSHGGGSYNPTPSHGGGSYNPTPSHGGGSYNPTPSTPSHGGGSYNPTPSTPSHGGGSYNPTPSTPSHGGGSSPSDPNCGTPSTPSDPHHGSSPSTPSGGGGGYYHSPPTSISPPTPVIVTPTPSTPTITPTTPTPSTPTITPTTPTPFIPSPPYLPDPNSFPGTCNFWSNHPTLIWGVMGWWGTVGNTFGTGGGLLTAFSPSMSLQQALSNTRSDGIGALYREGTASLLNSMVDRHFPFTMNQVRDSFVRALHSDRAAGAQAQLFRLANEGRLN